MEVDKDEGILWTTSHEVIDLPEHKITKAVHVMRREAVNALRQVGAGFDEFEFLFKGSSVRSAILADFVLQAMGDDEINKRISENLPFPEKAFVNKNSDIDLLLVFPSDFNDDSISGSVSEFAANIKRVLKNYSVRASGRNQYCSTVLEVKPWPNPAVHVRNLPILRIDICTKKIDDDGEKNQFPSSNICELTVNGKTGDLGLLHTCWIAHLSRTECGPPKSFLCGNTSQYQVALDMAVHDAQHGKARVLIYAFDKFVEMKRSLHEMKSESKLKSYLRYIIKHVTVRLAKLTRDGLEVHGYMPAITERGENFTCPDSFKTCIQNALLGLRVGRSVQSTPLEQDDEDVEADDGRRVEYKTYHLPKHRERRSRSSRQREREDEEKDHDDDDLISVDPVYVCQGCNMAHNFLRDLII